MVKFRCYKTIYYLIIFSLSADIVLFNSHFNKNSFLNNLNSVLKIIPCSSLNKQDIKSKIEDKSQVLYFPINFPQILVKEKPLSILHIIWPHRWEFDKNPEEFFSVLFKLKGNGVPFKLSVLGESFTDNPEIFATAKEYLKEEIVNFGFCENKDEYYKILCQANVVVSTAKHEFFGVSM